MHGAFLHHPGRRLSLSELTAARLDGDVVELGEAYVPADLVETPALRAASLAPVIERIRGAALAGMSAAWIHGAGDAPPEVHEVQSATGRRLRAPAGRRLIVHDAVLETIDLQHLGDVAVTTPERTLIDLLRWPAARPRRRDWARLLAEIDPSVLQKTALRLSTMPRGAGHQRILRFLAAHGLDDATSNRLRDGESRSQDEVTRYTS